MRLFNAAGILTVTLCGLLSPAEQSLAGDLACGPDRSGFACAPAACPTEGEECRPRCARYDPVTGDVRLTQCECAAPDHYLPPLLGLKCT